MGPFIRYEYQLYNQKGFIRKKRGPKGGEMGKTIVIEHQKHMLMGRDSKQQWRQGLEKGDQQ